MELSFRNRKIEKIFNNFSILSQKYGNKQARKIIQRMNEFKAAESLNDIKMLQTPRLHSLTGKAKGYWSVDLIHPFRLIIEPLNGDVVFLKTITIVKIIEITDYH